MPKEVKEAKKRMQVWLKEEYGPISYMQSMFNQSLVFISDFNLIKEVLKKQEASGRPKETKPFHEFRFGDSEGRVRGKKSKNCILIDITGFYTFQFFEFLHAVVHKVILFLCVLNL